MNYEELSKDIQRVRRYATRTELTPYALRELVKAVYVETPDKSICKRKQKIHIEYLRGLNDKYEDFIRNKYKGKVLTIDVDNLDYKNRPEDFKFITDKIDSILFGLFDLNDL